MGLLNLLTQCTNVELVTNNVHTVNVLLLTNMLSHCSGRVGVNPTRVSSYRGASEQQRVRVLTAVRVRRQGKHFQTSTGR